MASFADLLITGAQQSASQDSGISSGYHKGAALAMEQEKLEQNKSALKQKQTDNELAKLGMPLKVLEVINDPNTDPVQADNLAKNYLGQMVTALKIGHVYTPEFLETLGKSRDGRLALQGTIQQAEERILSGEPKEKVLNEYLARMSDPLERTIFLNEGKQFQAASKFSKEAAHAKERAEIAERASMNKQIQAQQETPNVNYRTKLSTDAAKFNTGGGAASAYAKIDKLDKIIADLEKDAFTTGSTTDVITGIAGARVQGYFKPKLKNAKATVNSVIELKSQLDSSFSDKAMLEVQSNLGVDDSLPPDMVLERMKTLRDQMKTEVKNKVEEFTANGFPVKGGSPKKPWSGLPENKKKEFKSLPSGEQDKAIKGLLDKFDIPLEQLRKELGL